MEIAKRTANVVAFLSLPVETIIVTEVAADSSLVRMEFMDGSFTRDIVE